MKKYFKYKGITVNAFGIPVSKSSFKKSGKKQSTILDKTDQEVRQHCSYYESFKSPFTKRSPKNLIIMFDIPNNLKRERDWFRRQLISFGFEMVQKSVWVGPSPLPVEFVSYLRDINISDKFKIFRLAKPYNPSITYLS